MIKGLLFQALHRYVMNGSPCPRACYLIGKELKAAIQSVEETNPGSYNLLALEQAQDTALLSCILALGPLK